MVVPLPFSKAIFVYGEPVRIARDEDVEQARIRVERALNALADEAERNFDALWNER
ncbi:MAG TPA: hypothetical protein VNL91_04335 [Thermoanaerobaculia bacterium]|nr:hypothetical protein [Thermoanaerobaculia bacterium]